MVFKFSMKKPVFFVFPEKKTTNPATLSPQCSLHTLSPTKTHSFQCNHQPRYTENPRFTMQESAPIYLMVPSVQPHQTVPPGNPVSIAAISPATPNGPTNAAAYQCGAQQNTVTLPLPDEKLTRRRQLWRTVTRPIPLHSLHTTHPRARSFFH